MAWAWHYMVFNMADIDVCEGQEKCRSTVKSELKKELI